MASPLLALLGLQAATAGDPPDYSLVLADMLAAVAGGCGPSWQDEYGLSGPWDRKDVAALAEAWRLQAQATSAQRALLEERVLHTIAFVGEDALECRGELPAADPCGLALRAEGGACREGSDLLRLAAQVSARFGRCEIARDILAGAEELCTQSQDWGAWVILSPAGLSPSPDIACSCPSGSAPPRPVYWGYSRVNLSDELGLSDAQGCFLPGGIRFDDDYWTCPNSCVVLRGAVGLQEPSSKTGYGELGAASGDRASFVVFSDTPAARARAQAWAYAALEAASGCRGAGGADGMAERYGARWVPLSSSAADRCVAEALNASPLAIPEDLWAVHISLRPAPRSPLQIEQE